MVLFIKDSILSTQYRVMGGHRGMDIGGYRETIQGDRVINIIDN